MEAMELLREKLHNAIDKGNEQEILRLSRELDMEILRFITIDKAISEIQNEKAS